MQGMGGFGGGGGGGMDPMGSMNPMSTGRLNMPGTGGNMGLDMHRIPVVGNFFQNPYDQFKQQQMQNAAGAYSMYRPEQVQAYMNAMNAQSASLQPTNNALAAMYGSGATQGFEAQNPYGPTAFQRGAAVGTNPSLGASGPSPQEQTPGSGGVSGVGATGLDMLGQAPGGIGKAVSQPGGLFFDGAQRAGQGLAGGAGTVGGAMSDWGSTFGNWAGGGSNWGGLGNGGWW